MQAERRRPHHKRLAKSHSLQTSELAGKVGRRLKVPLLRRASGGRQVPINEGRVKHENTEMAEEVSLLLVICGRLLRGFDQPPCSTRTSALPKRMESASVARATASASRDSMVIRVR